MNASGSLFVVQQSAGEATGSRSETGCVSTPGHSPGDSPRSRVEVRQCTVASGVGTRGVCEPARSPFGSTTTPATTARRFNLTENVRPIPATDPDFRDLFRRRNDAESTNRGLDDSLWLRRAHSVGHRRQLLNLLGYAAMVNSLSIAKTRRRRSFERRCGSRTRPARVVPCPRAPGRGFSARFCTSPALVAQRIEHRPPEPCAQVRVLPRAPGDVSQTSSLLPGKS